jgi:general secretion pathway protein G
MTLVELLLAVALVGVLGAIAVPTTADYVNKARRAKAIADIQVLQSRLLQYHENTDQYPDSLATIQWTERDVWGNPYQYLKIEGAPPSVIGQARKDRFLVPLNSTYDLYSMGADGQSRGPLSAKVSQDDILRANDGQFVGVAADY